MTDLESTWHGILEESARKVQELRNSLEDWELYTETMEQLMTWLRDVEKMVKRPLTECTVEHLEEQLLKCQVRPCFISSFLNFDILGCFSVIVMMN